MEKFDLKKGIALGVAMVMPFVMSGCSKRSDCELPTSHVHLYKKAINSSITISKWVDCENEDYWGYKWQPDYIEITKDDEQFYKTARDLYNGEDNWPYLFALMKSNPDWLEFYYEYCTYETRTETDSDGKTHTYTERVHHDGWHTDPYDSDNTGRVRMGHVKYHGYRIVKKNGKYVREKSRNVDDIRDIIDDYPYFEDKPGDIVYSYHNCNRWDLPKLSPASFASDFGHPRLDTNEIHPNKGTSYVINNTKGKAYEIKQSKDSIYAPAQNTGREYTIDNNRGKAYMKRRYNG